MKGYLYLLRSKKKANWFYVGSTRDLKSRFTYHNNGKVKSTKAYVPFDLAYYEAYQNYTLAKKREISFKKNSKKKEDLIRRLKFK